MKNKGISLIVLVITILVLAILATTVIISLNNTNIIEQAGNTVREHNLQTLKEVVNLKVISHMAEHNGSINMAELQTELEELGSDYVVSSSNNSIIVTSSDGAMKVEVQNTGAVVVVDSDSQASGLIFEAGSVIPEGGTYYVGVGDTEQLNSATAMFTAGQTFPAFEENDVFVYGDYEYRYNCELEQVGPSDFAWKSATPFDGWGVKVLNQSKASYGQIASKINGKDVKALNHTFSHCWYLESAPEIPDGIISMNGTFCGCSVLTGTITINANPASYNECFSYTSKQITLTGSSTKLSELAATSTEGNVTVLN